MKTKRPDFLPKEIPFRQWKAQKRLELKTILRAVDDYQRGCAYCPGYDTDIDELFEVLEKMKKSHSYKAWG